MTHKSNICVVGSINMDMVTTTAKMPDQGETVLGESFTNFPGGKGANQAVAAARLGANVSMIGVVGNDTFGKSLRNHFHMENIHQEGIYTSRNASTGIATIILSDQDNRIIVSPGANNKLTPKMIDESEHLLSNSDVVLLQFEIPMETVEHTVNLAHKHNVPVIINPAPYHDISEDILQKATFITPNEIEYQPFQNMASYQQMKHKFIITKGKEGITYTSKSGKTQTIPAFHVPVTDTTGAGDTFNGAFATEWARTNDLEQAITFANAAAALSIQRPGAQSGMPTHQEVLSFIKQNNK